MHRFQIQALTAMAAWALGAAAMNAPIARDYLSGICPRGSQDVEAFAATLSKSSQIYFPGSEEFVNASTRWSVLGAPTVSVVIVPGTEKDVVETVRLPELVALALFLLSELTAGRLRSNSRTNSTSLSLPSMAYTAQRPRWAR